MSTDGRTRDPKQIEAELDRTRMRMGDTLDKLQHKFSPGELFDQAVAYARANTSSEFGSNLRLTIARNPLPVALVGLGLAWLMVAGRRGSVGADYESHTEDALTSDFHTGAYRESSASGPGDEDVEGLDEARPTADGGKTSGTQTGIKHL